MKLINIGFGSMIAAERLLAVVSPDSAPVKRIIQEAKEERRLIDATYGRRTRAVIISDSDHVILSALKAGEIDLLVGTHALFSEGVEYNNLALVIADEQHRFGVKQRDTFFEKGQTPHVLVMSATPIPRTLAFVLYGDLDVSVLDEMPKNRIPVKTYLVTPDLSQRAFNFVRNFAKEGKQSYIICPLVERNEDSLPLEAAADLAEQIAGQELVDCNVGLLHGRMKPAEKERVMEAFAENRLQVLVSTTVVEVGVDVPNAVCSIWQTVRGGTATRGASYK